MSRWLSGCRASSIEQKVKTYRAPSVESDQRNGLLPLLLNLLLAPVLLVGLPWLFKAPLFGLTYVFSDLGYTLLVGGVLALGWGVVRTVLAYLVLRPISTPGKSLAGPPPHPYPPIINP